MQPSVVSWRGGGAVRFHRRHRDPLVHVAAANDDVGVAEDRVVRPDRWRRAATLSPCASNTIGAPSASASSGTHDGRQRLVVDDDHVGRVLRLGGGLGEDDGHDRLADEANDVAGQRWSRKVVVHLDEARGTAGSRVVGGEHGDDAGRRGGVGGVDATDPRVRHLRADEHRMQRVGEVEIGDESAGAEQQLGIFRAKHPRAENRTCHRRNLSNASMTRLVGETPCRRAAEPT